MKKYPGKLYHGIPSWVEPGSVFHVRIRSEFPDGQQLVEEKRAASLLASVQYYTRAEKWYHHLFVVMPDHVHALLSFPAETGMSQTIRDWKRYHTRDNRIIWQDNYFDHRIRSDESYREKADYIRMNPVRMGLCKVPDEWPWVIDAQAVIGGRRCP